MSKEEPNQQSYALEEQLYFFTQRLLIPCDRLLFSQAASIESNYCLTSISTSRLVCRESKKIVRWRRMIWSASTSWEMCANFWSERTSFFLDFKCRKNQVFKSVLKSVFKPWYRLPVFLKKRFPPSLLLVTCRLYRRRAIDDKILELVRPICRWRRICPILKWYSKETYIFCGWLSINRY